MCRGNSKAVLDTNKCGLCKKSHKDYKDANLEGEVEEFRYLRTTWIKCKTYMQNTTGMSKLDLVLEVLFGKPHNGPWRDYTIAPDAARFGLNSGVLVRSCSIPEQYVGPPL